MIDKEVDVAIIGGGPAGMAAALATRKAGVEDILLIERNESLGGILNQCIHEGFGVEIFKEVLTGPEYMQRFVDKIEKQEIPHMLDSMVIDISKDKELVIASESGLHRIKAKAIILAMGARERTRGQIGTPGSRPAGVYTAGAAQNFINLMNLMPGKKVVILGSGDIGLITARRLTLEGAKVLAVVEILPYSSGLPRNITQCLEDYEIPLYLKHTVTEIKGNKRVESVSIAEVDDKWCHVPGTEREFDCDTLLLSVGLIPENELSRNAGIVLDPVTGGPRVNENLETSVEGIFACGNSLHVHDIVDFVTMEGDCVGIQAANFVKGKVCGDGRIDISAGNGVGYVLPQCVSGDEDVKLSLRVREPGRDRKLLVKDGDRTIKEIKKPKVNPAEMIKVGLKKDELKGVKSLSIELE